MHAELDHLVIAAASLDEGVAWCAATLGVAPVAGGAHPQMGTHNRIFSVGGRRYAELLAVDPAAPAPGRPRWFALDTLDLSAGPRLVGCVARTADLAAAHEAFVARGLDPGPPTRASRTTPAGLLEWQLTVPADGARPLDGGLPLLIQWGTTHPTDSLPDVGVTLRAFAVAHPRAAELRALGILGVDFVDGAPALRATFEVAGGRTIAVTG